MRSDIPAEERQVLEQKLALAPPDLRATIEAAIDAQYPTVEQEARARVERDREQRKKDAHEQRELAAKVERALGGEWGDDIRRAVDELVGAVKPGIVVLADWAKRARRREPLTKIEWLNAMKAVDSTAVRYGLAAARKVIAVAERERRSKP